MVDSHESLPVPDEIILRILSFSNPLDVIRRARLVSKQFRDITYDTELWRVLYTNARLLRPHGPLPSQSTEFLERTLVQSALVEQSWVTEPLQEIGSREVSTIRWDPERSTLRFVCGRWFVTCESSRNIVLHEIDADDSAKLTIWRNDELIWNWDACCVGRELIYLFICDGQDSPVRSMKFLEFKVNGEHGPVLCKSLDIPKVENNAIVTLLAGESPFVCFLGLGLFFDTRTRTFYELPPFRTELGTFPRRPNHLLFLTATHILVCVPRSRRSSLIQVFVIPPNPRPSNRPPALCLINEYLANRDLSSMQLIRDSLVDPHTGWTSLRFLDQSIDGNKLRLSCLHFTLLQPRNGAVFPIFVDTHDILSISTPCSPLDLNLYVEGSEDGHVRGVCIFHDHPSTVHPRERYGVKFAIEATHDRCTSLVGELALAEAKGGYNTRSHFPTWFDGVRGRLCVHSYMDGDSRDTTPFIVDIK